MVSLSHTREQLEDAVHDYVVSATGLDDSLVIISEQHAPAPNGPYCTIKYLPDTDIGIDSEIARNNVDDDTQSDVRLIGIRNAFFSVQFYRAGAYDNARKMQNYHQTPTGRLLLEAGFLTFRRVSQVRAIDTIVSDKFEDRAGIDLEFIYVPGIVETVNSLGSVSIGIDMTDSVDIHDDLEVTDE